ICVISSTLLHFSCCKVKKNNSIIKILFHNFHIICYYMMLLFVLGVSVLTVITAYSPEKWKEIIDKVNE
ncbi:hypothetical protein, partial [Segatella copri]|uniref:hypothetical protein n=1 Tax=Segatella copri TaxID=165179 RepID=UPI003F88A96A